jgi:hypothetical protein
MWLKLNTVYYLTMCKKIYNTIIRRIKKKITDRHDITEILLNVEFNTIDQTYKYIIIRDPKQHGANRGGYIKLA